MTFLVETPSTKKLAEIFCEAFLKQSPLQSCRTYFRFSKWGSLNSIAVRIRVKIFTKVTVSCFSCSWQNNTGLPVK
jgi:hypothetical protein